jgi:DivIVA domain-containing protein
MWVWVVVIVVLIGAVVVIAVGRDDAMAEVYDDRPDLTIPSGRPLTADDLSEIRFSTATRGYRMDEVDAFIARLQADLLAREQREPGAHRAPADETDHPPDDEGEMPWAT